MIQQLDEKSFDNHIKNGIKFVAFLADWCGYCQKQKPILTEIADNNIWVGIVDSDENPKLVQQYNVNAFPYFLLFKEGKQIASFMGYKTKYELLNILLGYLQ